MGKKLIFLFSLSIFLSPPTPTLSVNTVRYIKDTRNKKYVGINYLIPKSDTGEY